MTPRKPRAERRTVRMHILFTREEWGVIDGAARREGETISAWIRRAIRERLSASSSTT